MKEIKGIRPYLPFTRNVFQRLISYKANAIIFMFGDFLMLAVTYYLWKAIYESSSQNILNGFNFNEMIIYLFISFLTSIMINVDISYDISREVKDGSIAINLVRPISYRKRMFFQGLGNILYNFVIIFIIAFFATTFLFYKFFGYISIFRIIIYFISIILGIFINFYFSYIFGLISFKITNMWGLSQIMQSIVNLLSGTLIPIAFFPKWAQAITNLFPFSSTIYTPSMIYLGKINGMNILFSLGIQIFWVVVLMFVSKKMWKALIKSLTILGG